MKTRFCRNIQIVGSASKTVPAILSSLLVRLYNTKSWTQFHLTVPFSDLRADTLLQVITTTNPPAKDTNLHCQIVHYLWSLEFVHSFEEDRSPRGAPDDSKPPKRVLEVEGLSTIHGLQGLEAPWPLCHFNKNTGKPICIGYQRITDVSAGYIAPDGITAIGVLIAGFTPNLWRNTSTESPFKLPPCASHSSWIFTNPNAWLIRFA